MLKNLSLFYDFDNYINKYYTLNRPIATNQMTIPAICLREKLSWNMKNPIPRASIALAMENINAHLHNPDHPFNANNRNVLQIT